jgi:hypothetical protein
MPALHVQARIREKGDEYAIRYGTSGMGILSLWIWPWPVLAPGVVQSASSTMEASNQGRGDSVSRRGSQFLPRRAEPD